MSTENQKTPQEQWVESQRMLDAFRRPGKLSREMRKKMNASEQPNMLKRMVSKVTGVLRRK